MKPIEERLRDGDPTVTIGDSYRPAMAMTDPTEAEAYFALLVLHIMKKRPELSIDEAVDIEKQNLGYFSGYYDTATQARVEKLFKTFHPIFGPLAAETVKTPEDAFRLGVEMGKRSK